MAIQLLEEEDIKAINNQIRNVISHSLDRDYRLDKHTADAAVWLPAALLPNVVRVRLDSPRMRAKFQALFDRFHRWSCVIDDHDMTKEYIFAASELLFWTEAMSALNEYIASVRRVDSDPLSPGESNPLVGISRNKRG
jgi:hypothetical protein